MTPRLFRGKWYTIAWLMLAIPQPTRRHHIAALAFHQYRSVQFAFALIFFFLAQPVHIDAVAIANFVGPVSTSASVDRSPWHAHAAYVARVGAEILLTAAAVTVWLLLQVSSCMMRVRIRVSFLPRAGRSRRRRRCLVHGLAVVPPQRIACLTPWGSPPSPPTHQPRITSSVSPRVAPDPRPVPSVSSSPPRARCPPPHPARAAS